MSVVGSKIAAVKVYHIGATVYRRLELSSESGRLPEEIEIAELPLALADVSVRVRVVSPAGIELEASSLRVGLYVTPRRELHAEPDREEKKKLDREIEQLQAGLRQRGYELGVLSGMEVPERPRGEEGKQPPLSPIGARIALEDLVDEAVQKRIEERRALEKQLDDLEKRSADLAQRIAAASNARTAEAHEVTKSVTVRLRQGSAPIPRAELELEYFIPGARWAPAYQCRLSRDAANAELTMRALVVQASGEDWRGVRIQLSTASPLAWTELPELASVRIGKSQPPLPARRGFRKPPHGAQQLFEDYDRDRRRAEALLPQQHGYSAPVLSLLPPGSWDHATAGSGRGPAARASRAVTDVAAAVYSVAHAPPPPPQMPSPAPKSAMAMKPLAKRRGGSRDDDDPTVDGIDAGVSEDFDEMSAMSLSDTFGAARYELEEMGEAPMLRELAKKRPPSPRNESQRAQIVATVEAYAFQQLRLASADDTNMRSHLRAVDVRTAYLESLARLSIEVKVDVVAIVEAATRRAAQVANLPLPKESSDVRHAAGHFDFLYEADAPVDVASDGAWHSIPLGSRASECTMQYVVVPREDPSVFRIAQLKNPLLAPLLPGPAEIYVGGEYVLTTRIPTVTPQGELELGLGVEQAIKCARNTRFEEKRSGSKVVATNELWHDLEVTLVNNLEREVKCEVRERIPQPHADAEVVVEEGKVEPAWEPYDQEERRSLIEGGRRWTITIPPHKESKLKAQYVVKIYANNELSGGNRREA